MSFLGTLPHAKSLLSHLVRFFLSERTPYASPTSLNFFSCSFFSSSVAFA